MEALFTSLTQGQCTTGAIEIEQNLVVIVSKKARLF